MKKVIVGLVMVFMCSMAWATSTPISVDAFVSPDDVTITHLEDFRATVVDRCNNMPGDAIEDKSILVDQLADTINIDYFRNEAFNDWVVFGLIQNVNAVSLARDITDGLCYVGGRRISKDNYTTSTYTASKWTFVDIDNNGTYSFTERSIGDADPGIAGSSMRLCRVSSDGSGVVAVRDDRIMAISLDSNQSDNWREEMLISVVTPDTIYISPGIVYVGSNKVHKTTVTELDITVAGNWVVGSRNQEQMSFVVANAQSQIFLSGTAPTVTDTADNANGVLRYVVDGGSYYRVLGWFYLDSTGAGTLTSGNYGNFKDGGNVPNVTHVSRDEKLTIATDAWTSILTNKIYTSGKPITVYGTGSQTGSAAGETSCRLEIDGITRDITQMGSYEQGVGNTPDRGVATPTMGMFELPQGTHNIEFQMRSNGRTGYVWDGNLITTEN